MSLKDRSCEETRTKRQFFSCSSLSDTQMVARCVNSCRCWGGKNVATEQAVGEKYSVKIETHSSDLIAFYSQQRK